MADSENSQTDTLSAPAHLPKKRRGCKHVSFPPDEDMVSGIEELRTPSKLVDSITLMEVMSAYKQSCVKYHVEPISKVLQQLQEGAIVQGRCAQLDLQGERLDNHSCETLEDILKLLQFDFINLRETELEENGAASLLDMILYYESAKHLDISFNANIGISGWQALSHLIQQSRYLERLDASDMPLLERPARLLSGSLLTSRLSVLHLDNSSLSGTPLFTLVGILKMNTTLRELYLANNKLNSFQDSMQLGDLLKFNQSLKCLDISNNLITDSGLEEICDGLKAQRSRLQQLMLRSNHLTNHGMVHLAGVLPSIKTLEILNLGNNNLENQGVQILKEALISSPSLLQLGLGHTGITCEGVVVLAEFIAESRHIQQLDICENLIGTGGLLALSHALKFNRTLVKVELDKNPKEEEDDFLIETQKNLLCKISERLKNNATTNGTKSWQQNHPACYISDINPAAPELSYPPSLVSPASPGSSDQSSDESPTPPELMHPPSHISEVNIEAAYLSHPSIHNSPASTELRHSDTSSMWPTHIIQAHLPQN
ncbi:protein phosphatase 1 regulatory subunit 37 [Brienomyrus brachyistius]|uniref:protein phosphatase 1 regulatory subunit 37 n=1 Tax=Brienomyrus brachyistius TaxID=42636 RepID=UPI0020B1BEBD|nr:protein phosphatase 1 regulatory subunit 37 [Brienomyrus brachyistius]